jgi:hypothetical protein
VQAINGNTAEGIRAIEEGYQEHMNQEMGNFFSSVYSCVLGEAYLRADNSVQAIVVLQQGLQIAQDNAELCYISEIYRLLADAFLTQKNKPQALVYIKESLKWSADLQLLSFELKSALEYASLTLMSNDDSGVRDLCKIVDRFGSNEQSVELEEARELIAELSLR